MPVVDQAHVGVVLGPPSRGLPLRPVRQGQLLMTMHLSRSETATGVGKLVIVPQIAIFIKGSHQMCIHGAKVSEVTKTGEGHVGVVPCAQTGEAEELPGQ